MVLCRHLVDLWSLSPDAVRPHIERLGDLPDAGFEVLRAESEQAGLRFLRRLADDWASGVNRFHRPGEALFALGFRPSCDDTHCTHVLELAARD